MSGRRASVFETDDADLDVSGFTPKRSDEAAARAGDVRTVSEGASFRSREPRPVPALPPEALPRREPRRYRTGRNMQLNIKARAEAIEAFYAIADAQGWVLGETFERAVAALEAEIAGGERVATTKRVATK